MMMDIRDGWMMHETNMKRESTATTIETQRNENNHRKAKQTQPKDTQPYL